MTRPSRRRDRCALLFAVVCILGSLAAPAGATLVASDILEIDQIRQHAPELDGLDKLTGQVQRVAVLDTGVQYDHPDLNVIDITSYPSQHKEQVVKAAQAGKHLIIEKPLGLNANEVQAMTETAETHQVVHMTAFTYRFAPSMRYLKHLVQSGALGSPRHFRSQRFLDWPETSWGWRQYRDKAGAGDLFDMTIHRIDFAVDLLGPLERLCGSVARFAARDRTVDGQPCPPSEVDDWSSIIGRFASGATGVWEGTTLAKGYGLAGFGHEWAEVNGSEASAVYRLHEPNSILLGRTGGDLAPVDVPAELLKPSASPRNPADGKPADVFRYDLVWEFVSAIIAGRPAIPSFYDGYHAQCIADAVLESEADGRWVAISPPKR